MNNENTVNSFEKFYAQMNFDNVANKCSAITPVPDEVRGQIVKATIVLTKGTEPTEELKAEIQKYVKEHTAPYKYPRLVVFRDELPKTTSGKIQRNKL